MSANPRTWLFHGPSGTTTDLTGAALRHKQADDDAADLNNPIPIPSSGTSYGWPKFMKVAWTSTPSQFIRNLRWYMDPRPETGDPAGEWQGMTMWAGLTATYTQGNSADSTTPRPGLVNADIVTSASPLVITSGNVLVNPSTGPGTQTYVVMQLSVNGLALGGVKAERRSYYRWEEV